jgi:hypothetical protein
MMARSAHRLQGYRIGNAGDRRAASADNILGHFQMTRPNLYS